MQEALILKPLSIFEGDWCSAVRLPVQCTVLRNEDEANFSTPPPQETASSEWKW